jgi:HSP20 family protein
MQKKKTKSSNKTIKKPKLEIIENKNSFNDLIDLEKNFFNNDLINLFGKINLPSTDILNKKDSIELTADLPGVDKKDIKICVNKDSVEISAEKKFEKNTSGKEYYRQERTYSGYHRVISLPAIVDPNKTQCDFKNGTLKLTIKKLKDSKDKPKMITLK